MKVAHVTRVNTAAAARAARPAAAPRPGAGAEGAAPARSIATSFKPMKMSVRERFATLHERFLPDKAKGVNHTWQFDLSGSDGGQWWVKISNGKLEVKKGRGPGADATIKASAEDYRKIADGEMNSTLAYLRGKLKIDGDKDVAKKFPDFFKKAS